MSECLTACDQPVTKTVTVQYELHVSINGASGVQVWGKFHTLRGAETTVAALATRSNVDKVEIVEVIQ